MSRRAFAALALLAAAAALAAGLEDVARAAPLLAGLCAAAGLSAAFSPDAPPRWLAAGAAFSAAAAARLLGLWSADPSLGFALTAVAGAAGAALAAFGAAPTEETSALAWTAAGGLLLALEPNFLRFLGQNDAAPARLFFGTRRAELLLLGQPLLLAAAAAAAVARGARGLARPARETDALAAAAGAALAAALIPPLDAALALGASGAFLALAAAARTRPWSSGAPKTLRGRFVLAAAVAAALLAAAAPAALLKVWTARLDSLYPGGNFLGQADDGVAAWSAYRFSHGERVLLRDGLIQRDDAAASTLALDAALGQRPRLECSVLVVRPPGPQTLDAAGRACSVAVEDGSAAEAAALDAEVGPDWRRLLAPSDGKFDAVLTVLRTPLDRGGRRLISPARLEAARARLADGGAAVFLIPTFTGDYASLDALARSAAAVFGRARAAMLPTGDGIVLASAAEPVVDPDLTLVNLPARARPDDAEPTRRLLAAIKWRPAPSAK